MEYKSNQKNENLENTINKGCLYTICGIFILIFGIILINIITSVSLDKNIKILKKAAKITTQQAGNINKSLLLIEYPGIHKAECYSYNDNIHCSIDNYEYPIGIWVDSDLKGNVKTISDLHATFYKDGKILAKYKDYNISKDYLIAIINNSIEIAKQNLKSPATAQFSDWKDWGYSVTKDKISLTGGVDSQNSFGAYIHTPLEFNYNRIYGISEKFKLQNAKVGNLIIEN